MGDSRLPVSLHILPYFRIGCCETCYGCGRRIRTNDLRVIASRRLAVPEKPFGLSLILRFFDRSGSKAIAFSATGSAKAFDPNELRSPEQNSENIGTSLSLK